MPTPSLKDVVALLDQIEDAVKRSSATADAKKETLDFLDELRTKIKTFCFSENPDDNFICRALRAK